MKKLQDSQKRPRNIPLVQIPYDKTIEEARLAKIKMQRKKVKIANWIVVCVLVGCAAIQLLHYSKSGGVISFGVPRLKDNIMGLYKHVVTVPFVRISQNIEMLPNLLIQHVNINFGNMYERSEGVLIKHVLENIGALYVPSNQLLLQIKNCQELQTNTLKIINVARDNIFMVYAEILKVITDAKSNLDILMRGGQLFFNCAKKQIENMLDVKLFRR